MSYVLRFFIKAVLANLAGMSIALVLIEVFFGGTEMQLWHVLGLAGMSCATAIFGVRYIERHYENDI